MTAYTTGTITLTHGSKTVSGIDTGWQTAIIASGVIHVQAEGGNALPFDIVTSDTEITAAIEWTGASGTYAYALIRETAYGTQQIATAIALSQHVQRLNNPGVAAVAGVLPSSDTLLMFTGPSTATTITRSDLLQGVDYDEAVADIAGLAIYDAEAASFSVLVANAGDNRAAIFVKRSATVADWIGPAFLTGPVGPSIDLTDATAASLDYGQEPTVTLTRNPDGSFSLNFGIPQGQDGDGVGDVQGPDGGTAINQLVGFINTTGKRIKGLTGAQARGSLGADLLSGFRNKLINGDFSIMQRVAPFTANGVGIDRWTNAAAGGTTFSVSRSALALGQSAIPGEAEFCQRMTITAAGAVGSYFFTQQRIEGVKTLSGRLTTFTAWMRGVAGQKVAIVISQNFGSGGSPSAAVSTPVGIHTFTTADFEKVQFTALVPSVLGKTKGTTGDFLALEIWLSAGSNWDGYLGGSINNQSGDFYLAHASLVEGDATQEADPFSPRHMQQEIALCQRYYETVDTFVRSTSSDNIFFKVKKRVAPTVSGGGSGFSNGSVMTTDMSFATQTTAAFQTLRYDAEL